MKKLLIILVLIIFGFFNSKSQSSNPFNQTPSEDDWTLPATVTKTANAGLYWVNTVPDALNLLL